MSAVKTEEQKAASREASRRYRERHPERVAASSKRHRQSEKGRATAAKASRAWRAKNPGCHRKHHLKELYDLTLEQYDQMFELQNGVCKICEKPSDKRLHVDHCHETGRVRGLLCMDCNLLLGNANDDPEILSSAISYLKVG